jgi:hypothetical protein
MNISDDQGEYRTSTIEEAIELLLAAEVLGFSWTASARWERDEPEIDEQEIESVSGTKEYTLVIYEQDPPL